MVKGWLGSLGMLGVVLASGGCATRPERPMMMAAPSTMPTAVHAAMPAAMPLDPPAPTPVLQAVVYEDLEAVCMPPAGWIAREPKYGGSHARRSWMDPAGTVGYCVVKAKLPLPLGESLVLAGFLAEVEKLQGKTTIIAKRSSEEGLIFVAESPLLHYEGRVHCNGFRGWIVFASRLTDKPAAPEEMRIAEAARDATVLGQ